MICSDQITFVQKWFDSHENKDLLIESLTKKILCSNGPTANELVLRLTCEVVEAKDQAEELCPNRVFIDVIRRLLERCSQDEKMIDTFLEEINRRKPNVPISKELEEFRDWILDQISKFFPTTPLTENILDVISHAAFLQSGHVEKNQPVVDTFSYSKWKDKIQEALNKRHMNLSVDEVNRQLHRCGLLAIPNLGLTSFLHGEFARVLCDWHEMQKSQSLLARFGRDLNIQKIGSSIVVFCFALLLGFVTLFDDGKPDLDKPECISKPFDSLVPGKRLYIYRDYNFAGNRGVWGSEVLPKPIDHYIGSIGFKPFKSPGYDNTGTKVKVIFYWKKNPRWLGLAVSVQRDYWGEWEAGDLDLSKAKKLVFYARGEKGGEQIQVKAAIAGDKPFGDCTDLPITSNWITLEKSWKKYEITVDGSELKRVITPFYLTAKNNRNDGDRTVFYVDEIYYE